MKSSVLLLFALLCMCVPVFGTPLLDPGLPDGETALYRITQQKESWEYSERVAVVEGDIASYRFEYDAPGESTTVLIDRKTMRPYAIRNLSKGDSLAIESTTNLDVSEDIQTDAIMVLSFSEMKYLLRGYPFEAAPDLEVTFFSTEDNDDGEDFSIRVRYRGTETVSIGSRDFETHKLELKFSASGVFRMLSALVPKTYYWYSVDPSHYLVAYEGSSGFPGSPKRRIEIVEYSGW